ncbi:MAG: hypothetical protein VCA36_11905, partial [Opitutales bacterium]
SLRLDWFSSLVPWEMDETWKLPELSLEAWSEGGDWKMKVDPVEVLQGSARMAGATKLVGKLTEANSTARLLELDVEGSVERGLLRELLPREGPLAVFDENDSRCTFAGAVAFSSEGMVLRRGEVKLASGEGARKIHMRVMRELKLDPGQSYFLTPETRGDLFSVKGNNLPVDGLIRWKLGGEVQGDAEAFSGKVSHNEKGWVFRSDEAVEIDNARIVRGETTYGEGLRARANLEVILDDEGRLRINSDDLILEGAEKTSFTGRLGLVAEPSEKGGFLARTVESSGLKIDLTTLSWLGFREISKLESGFLEIGKFKASFGDDFTFELDGALVDFRVVDEAPMKGGVQATVRRQPDGFSTWIQLSLTRENRESAVTLDVFLPREGNASRRKLSLSGEQVHADELLAFAATILVPRDLEALLEGERFPDWALGDWELAINDLRFKGLPPFEEVKAKLALRSTELLLSYAKAKWLSGFVSMNGALSLGGSDEPGVRLHTLDAKADQVEITNLTKRVEGFADVRLTGWSDGSDWGEAFKAFAGKVTLTARDGVLRLGPLNKADAEGELPETPWSLARLGQLLEGKVSLSESREILLGKMDSALEEVRYDLFQMVAERAADGNFTVTKLSVRGPSFQVDGNGKVTSFPEGEEGGALNLNLSFGARGELAKTLQGLGVLAPVKAEGEYRKLKKDPLVVQGTMEKPDFSNFWALLAEGLGLSGFDLPEPK